MSIKISELESASSLTGEEEIPIVQSGTTKKVSVNLIPPTRTIALLMLGDDTTDNTFTISNITTSYNPIDITTMTLKNINSDYCTYNSTNGRLTFSKSCKVKMTMSTQIRCSSSNSFSTPMLAKGFGCRIFNSSGTQKASNTIAEQTFLSGYATMTGVIFSEIEATDYIIPMAYSRIMGSGSTSESSKVWGYGRTSLEIELLEETASSQNRGTLNTSSFAKLGEKIEEVQEVKKEAEEEINEKGSGDNE